MGQMFHACAYDTETKICCVMDADKFHANCYGHSGRVGVIHYMLRQKPYRVMWCGDYAVYGNGYDDGLEDFEREEDLLGVSTYCNYESFAMYDEDLQENLEEKDYSNKVKFIDDNSKLWKHIELWDEASEYFNWPETRSVKYSGYLLNHTQKLAVDLEDYFSKSHYWREDIECLMAIDAIPLLTETGGGTSILFRDYDGLSVDTTEDLSETWCGDLLQITDNLSDDFKVINCCFADAWHKVKHCYHTFGVDESGYVMKDTDGRRFEAVKLGLYGERGPSGYAKAELNRGKMEFIFPRHVKNYPFT